MAGGPTQNYEDATLGAWKPHPALARIVRATITSVPLLLAVALGWVAVRWFSPQRLGLNPWLWLVCEVALVTAILLVVSRLLRRLLPLSTLLRLTLYFPDRAPSRFEVARRAFSPNALHERLERDRQNGATPNRLDHHAELLLGLVGALNSHDRTTFQHCERVQAYTALIATEMGLPPADVARLSWAALLHDVGKLRVPSDILNKTSRPSAQEWEVLSEHPVHGAEIAAPLAEWLGPWLGAIEQHHERWDGRGYPYGAAREEISHAARIVAVADAFDVITTARPYKRPLSATAARAELARCAGRQFDPEVVRAFLAVGLGRLRTVAGPLSLISALPGLRAVPVHDVGSTLSSVVSAVPAGGAAATATLVAAALTFTGPLAPGSTALARPATTEAPAPESSAASSPDHEPDEKNVGPGREPGRSETAEPHGTATPSHELATGSPVEIPVELEPDPADTDGDRPGGPAKETGSRPTRPSHEAGSDEASGTSDTKGASGSSGSSSSPPPPTPSASASPSASPTPPPETSDPCAEARAGVTDLHGAQLAGCDLSGMALAGVDLSGARLSGVDLSGARLSGADLSSAVISNASFDGASLVGANFAGAAITRSTFRGAEFNAQTFRDAELIDCEFE